MKDLLNLRDCRVLTIQSHVVSGYVGNKSATFPLQLLGFETDAINSVQFSNHTGYATYLGQILNSKDLLQLYDGLSTNNIDKYSHLLTGYTMSRSFLLTVADVCKKLKSKNPNLIYVCDPVLGDDGILYVSEHLVSVYRDDIIPLADVIVPNQFEAELLSEIKITNLETAKEAMMKLHSKGPEVVVISSTNFEINRGVLVALASSMKKGEFKCLKIEIPYLDAHYTGSGDLFAALLLAWWHQYQFDLKMTLETVVSTMYKVLKNTLDFYLKYAKDATLRKPNSSEIELKIIQSKKDIEEPEILFEAIYV